MHTGTSAVEHDEIELLRRELGIMRHELNSVLYAISHDLRAPIRVILGFAEALAEDHSLSLDEEGHEYLQRLRNATVALDHSLESLVELSRVSQKEMRLEAIAVSELAASIADALLAARNDREVELIIQPQLTALADRQLLEICLRHLLANALKFTRGRSPARVEVGREEHQGRSALYVRDNGVGFDPRYAEKMFGPFQRLHSSAEFEGTGMGLAVVQRIAHRHGAVVHAVGRVGEGTTVYLTL